MSAIRCAIAATSGSSALYTAYQSLRQTSALSAAYASSDPCQSRWSGAMFRTAPETNSTVEVQCSWKLDTSTASTSYGGSASTASRTGKPTLPVATAWWPAARRIDASICTVVVLPLVPVTPSHS